MAFWNAGKQPPSASKVIGPNDKLSTEPKALTAAAVRVNKTSSVQLRRLIQPWQQASLRYYDSTGEAWYAAQFYARPLSKLRLYAGIRDDAGEVTELEPSAEPSQLWSRVQDPGGGRSQLQASYGRLMFLLGEGYLTVTPDEALAEGERWEFLSSDELRVIPGGGYVRYGAPTMPAEPLSDVPDDQFVPLPGEAVVYRMWKRHPRYSFWADSPMNAVLGLFEELQLLQLAVRARAKSRMAGAGILYVPTELTFGTPNGIDDEDPSRDVFMEMMEAAMVAPISEPGSASAVVPLVIRGAAEFADKIKYTEIHNPLQTYPETGLRDECIKRIATGLDMPPELLLGMADANHWCVDDKTEILTREGWRSHSQISEGDTVLTLNHGSGESEWNRVEDVARFPVRDLEMLRMEGSYHSSLTTLNHRWPVLSKARVLVGGGIEKPREWATSETLKDGHQVVRGAQLGSLPTERTYSDAFVELVAWFWTEGGCRYREGRRAPQVTIYQSETANPEYCGRIRACLSACYGEASESFNGGYGDKDHEPKWIEAHSGDMLRARLNSAAALQLHEVAPGRKVSLEFVRSLTRDQLELFIDTSVDGDGSRMAKGAGTRSVCAKDADALDAVEYASILAGYATNKYASEHDGFNRHLLWHVSVGKRTVFGPKDKHKTRELYTGIVWCPVTENKTWLARRNGKVFYTGNTAWQIDEATWTAHLQPVAEMMCQDFANAYLRPACKAAGVPNWDQIVVGYDAADVINHPDRVGDAKDLNDRGVLSGAKLREVAGFTDEDAMDEEEHQEWLAIKTRDKTFLQENPDAEQQDVTDTNVVKAPPPEENLETEDTNQSIGASAAVTRIVAAAEMAAERCRELAGARLRTKSKGCPDCVQRIDGVPNTLVASTLGHDVASEYDGDSLALVAGGTSLFSEVVARQSGDGVASAVARAIELHVARTLYQEHPSILPDNFEEFVSRLL